MNEQLTEIGVIPVIVIRNVSDAMELGKAHSDAGRR